MILQKKIKQKNRLSALPIYCCMGGVFYMQTKSILKALLSSYGITTALLLLLAFLLFKFDLGENMVGAGITAVYILSCFIGGFVMGKNTKRQKYLWGALLGIIYFLLLIGVSLLVERGMAMSAGRIVTTLALCLGGGMLGGMLS